MKMFSLVSHIATKLFLGRRFSRRGDVTWLVRELVGAELFCLRFESFPSTKNADSALRNGA
jgi:hypothetical protein